MRSRAFIYIILAGILWGTSGVFVNYFLPLGLSPMQITTVRGVVSVIIMTAYLYFYNKNLFRISAKECGIFFLGAVAMFFTSVCYFLSMKSTSVSTAVVLMYTAPIIVLVYSVAFLGEKLNAIKTVSIIAMLLGCAFVSGVIGGFRFSFFGIFMGVASGFAYGAYNIITKIAMKNKSHPLTASTYMFAFMSLISAFVSDTTGIFDLAKSVPNSIYLMLGCGLCTCILPYFLYTLALKTLPAGTASSLAIVEPMAATIMSVLFLDEILSFGSFVGIVLIVGAVFLLGKSEV